MLSAVVFLLFLFHNSNFYPYHEDDRAFLIFEPLLTLCNQQVKLSRKTTVNLS